MIVTVTLNPSLQVRYDADRVELGPANRVGAVALSAGGRGLAVARLLTTFGHDVVAAGLAGGSAGELIRAELARAGVATQFTRISAESRRVVEVADASSGLVTQFAEPAPYITTEELGRLAADYRALLDGATAVVLCGTLPAGLPAETYGSLTSYAAGAGVPVILDAAGSALRHAAARGPALVVGDLTAGAMEPELPDVLSVVLPAGSGVRAAPRTANGARTRAIPRRTARARSPASGTRWWPGFVPGIALGWSWPDMLRHAVALAGSVGPDGEADLARYEAALPAVTVSGPFRP